jgi:hypothetical protein
MKDWVTLLTAAAGDDLRGETIEVACPLASRGFIRKGARQISGAINNVVVSGSDPTVNEIDGEPLPSTMVFGLTSTRLLVFELLTKTASAGAMKAAVPLSTIASVSAEKVKVFMVKSLAVDITLHDGTQLALEAGWPALKEGQRFVDALSQSCA